MNVTTLSTNHPFEPGVLTIERLKEAKRLIDSIQPAAVFGVAIFYSSLCLEKTNQPAKMYRRRRWQSERKAALVQKKWIKRWGWHMQPAIFKTPMGYFAHPSFKRRFEEAMAREQVIRERSAFDMRFIVA